MEKELEKIFYEMFEDLPCKGPGSFNSTKKAYNFIEDYLNAPLILDIGCGNGRQSLDLLKISDGTITAVDNYEPYIKELNEKIDSESLKDRAKAKVANMFDLPYADKSFDLIWSEGAIYIIGFEKGLREFKRLLKPAGFICVSEISWLVEKPSEEPYGFWTENYQGINSIDKNMAVAESAGYKNIAQFVLPESDWWDVYYKSLSLSLTNLREKYKHNDDALNIIDSEQYEIELYRKYSNEYGYVFYVLQLADGH